MSRSVRPSTPADAPAIKALFAATGLQPNADSRSLHWKYWQERSDWSGPRSFVLTGRGDIVAHGAIIPGAFLLGEQRIATAHVIDWAARPGEIGAGVALMKHIAQQVGSLLAIGGSEDTRRILPHIGFRAVGVATDYARPLFPLRAVHGRNRRDWRVLPGVARATLRKLTAPRATHGDWSTRPMATDDELRQLSAEFPAPSPTTMVLERSVGMFSYLLRCPVASMTLFAVQSPARTRGYFLLSSTPGQVRIADCWIDSGKADEWGALLLCAVERARADSQAVEVVIRASDPLLAEGLVRAGFHAGSQATVSVRPPPGLTVPAASLRVQMIDNDAAYFHEA
jgi:hypothetical protein